METPCELKQLTALDVYTRSLAVADATMYFLGRRDGRKLVASIGPSPLASEQTARTADGKVVQVGPADAYNAAVIRRVLPWTAPRLTGMTVSAGLGDRLGLATPGHIRAIRRHGPGVTPVLAQQSIREMTRTGRSPQDVMDAATWGVFQEGFAEGFGSDADHLQQPEDVERTAAAGFTMFTIDPGRHVDDQADSLDEAQLAERFESMDFPLLETSARDLEKAYVGRTFTVGKHLRIDFDAMVFLRAAVKYGRAVAHTARMYRHLLHVARQPVEVEVSVDETETPTTPAEHFFIATELARLGVRWFSLAPRAGGTFRKGVDYIGDLEELSRSFAQHVAVMEALGPYKLSIHSGSDKFSAYRTLAELAGGRIHLKTAGTSYLEALRAVAKVEPDLFAKILDFARGCYEKDKATYHVSADVRKVPQARDVAADRLPMLLEDFDARQVLHVTFGSVLTADAGERFRGRLYAALEANEEAYYEVLQAHLGRHVAPLAAAPPAGSEAP